MTESYIIICKNKKELKRVKLLDTGMRNENIVIVMADKKHELELKRRREQYHKNKVLKSKKPALTKSEINKRYRERHPERDKQQKRKWVLKNPHYHTNYSREWRNNLPPDKKEQYRKRHAEQENARYHRNKESILAQQREYRKRKKQLHNSRRKMEVIGGKRHVKK